MVVKDGRCYGKPFKTGRGLTQGEPLSPTVFNIVASALVGAVLLEVFVPQESGRQANTTSFSTHKMAVFQAETSYGCRRH